MNDEQLLRYSRNLLLPEIDMQGQLKFLQSRVMVIGCGGLGNTVIPILASSGVGELILVDFDVVELSNLQRQFCYSLCDIGRLKVEVMSRVVTQLNPDVRTIPISVRIDDKNLEYIINNYGIPDVLVDCSDNFETRYIINKTSVDYKIPWIFGAAIRFEGQLSVFDPLQKDSACYACLFAGNYTKERETCATTGVFSPAVSIIGAHQAAEALKLIGLMGTLNVGKLVCYDVLLDSRYTIVLKPNPNCPICRDT